FSVKSTDGPHELKVQLMCPNMADNYEKAGAERLNQTTILLRSNDFLDVWAQRNGWAPGVHNKKFKIRK
ncbi:MAG: hypothetical protein WCS27_17990, partial [Victivallaceae bacterium]